MARPTYGIDAVALALAVILAAAIAFLVSQIMPPLADLMMPPQYEVIVGDQIVGRIVLFRALRDDSRPWVWTIDLALSDGRNPTHGFEATCDAAMRAFARSWFREA